MDKIPVSGIVLTLNEAGTLRRCLQSMSFCSELLVVDSGSTDDTVRIAEETGARVLHHAWPGYGAQRDFSTREAVNDWVLCLDADEWLSPELAERIRAEFGAGPPFRAYSVPRRNFLLGRPLSHGGDYPDRKLRLFHREYGQWNHKVHASVETDMPVRALKEDLMHHTAESLAQAVEKWGRYAMMQAKEMEAEGIRPSAVRLLINPGSRFIKLYLIKQGFRDGVPGLAMAVLSSFFCFLKYLELWRLSRSPGGEAGSGTT